MCFILFLPFMEIKNMFMLNIMLMNEQLFYSICYTRIDEGHTKRHKYKCDYIYQN